MTEAAIMSIADAADMIVNGYAFTRDPKGFRVLNLNQTDKAAVITEAGEVLETSMDDIELQIALDYYTANRQFLEEEDA
ncbi:MAG: hypothetical protein IKQ80_04980 [Clostridia bacterium]|nr:hypothetical protein [Clostridia bacterium]